MCGEGTNRPIKLYGDAKTGAAEIPTRVKPQSLNPLFERTQPFFREKKLFRAWAGSLFGVFDKAKSSVGSSTA